jgi:4a-hydroxytetrahydrobiopterin dehydratase
MARRKLLSEDEIARRLREVPEWKREGNAIARTWTFDDFPPALTFINRVGELAEAANHHPDIYNSWATVRLSVTTHDAGGLTDRDFELAKRIDALR